MSETQWQGYLILVLALAPLILGVFIVTKRCEACLKFWAYQRLSTSKALIMGLSLDNSTWDKCKYCGHLRKNSDVYEDGGVGDSMDVDS